MVPVSSRDLLDLLLEDGSLSFDELQSFAASAPREDLFLDYKDGKLLDDPKRARQTVRRWVSGFGNAEGGVLVIGFDESTPRQVSPSRDRVGSETLDSWASKALAGMEGLFSPPPRFRTIPVEPGRAILLIATARAPQLIPCHEAGEVKFYLRFHDSTPDVPAYLISDLVLGRRQHPVIVPALHQATLRFDQADGPVSRAAHLSFSLSFENVSLVPARQIEIGLVGWSLPEEPDAIPMPGTRLIGDHIRQYVEFGSTPDAMARPLYFREEPRDLGSFDVTLPRSIGAFRVARGRSLVPVPGLNPKSSFLHFRGALHVLPVGSPPTWFELQAKIPNLPIWIPDPELHIQKPHLSIERLSTRRPVASCSLET